MTPAELREKRNSAPTHSLKLPISEDILTEVRVRLWEGLSWSDSDKEKRVRYLGCMWGFDMGARVSEYNRAEPGGSDHWVEWTTSRSYSSAKGILARFLEAT
jgi:hypothetical protein